VFHPLGLWGTPLPRTTGARRKKQKEKPSARRWRWPTRIPQLENLEPRLLLTLASDPDQPIDSGIGPFAAELGPIDTNATIDLAAVSADGTLTVALNRGDDSWELVTNTNPGLGPLVGMKLAPVDIDGFQD
jgi:hypothetical protein